MTSAAGGARAQRRGRRPPSGCRALEWARVAADCVVVATPRSSFVHEPSFGLAGAETFAEPMRGRGTRATTRHLLDGAVTAARLRARPGYGGVRQASERGITAGTTFSHAPGERTNRPPLTLARWVFRLAGSYRTTEATPRLLREAAERFEAAKRPRLAAWARERAVEETGHDRLALRDIEALGFDARALVEHVAPATSRALVEYFMSTVRAADGPIGCIGYAHMLESLALRRDARAIDAVNAVLPPGVDATRCLRVHSSLGSDRGHVDETVALVASLPAADRARIAASCFAAACVYYAPSETVTEERLNRLLLPFRQRAVLHPEARTCEET